MLSQNRNAGHFIAGIGVGLAAGCLLGILYAPQAGKKTRRQIASAVEGGVDYVSSKAEDTATYLRKETSRLKNEATDLLDRGQAAIGKGKAHLEDAIEKGSRLYRAATR
jgi:gas vesicle protein